MFSILQGEQCFYTVRPDNAVKENSHFTAGHKKEYTVIIRSTNGYHWDSTGLNTSWTQY